MQPFIISLEVSTWRQRLKKDPLWRGAEEKPVDKAQYKGLPRTTAQGLSVMKEPRLGQFLTQRLPPPPRILPPPSSPVRSTPGSNRSSAQREPVPGGDPSGHIGSPRKLGCGLSHSRDGLPLKGFREQQASLEACPGDVASRRQGSLTPGSAYCGFTRPDWGLSLPLEEYPRA